MPLVCDGFRPLTVEALRTISTLWSSQQIQMLANYGISIEDVTLPAACPWSPWKQGFQRSLHMTLWSIRIHPDGTVHESPSKALHGASSADYSPKFVLALASLLNPMTCDSRFDPARGIQYSHLFTHPIPHNYKEGNTSILQYLSVFSWSCPGSLLPQRRCSLRTFLEAPLARRWPKPTPGSKGHIWSLWKCPDLDMSWSQ